MSDNIKILILTNTFGKYKRQDIAVESFLYLKKLYPENIDILNVQFKDEKNSFQNVYNDIPVDFCLDISSKKYISNCSKKLPSISEIIFRGFRNDYYDYVVYVNSDVILLPRLVEIILNEKPDCMTGPRLDIDDIDSFQDVLQEKIKPIRTEIAGYDYFVFEKKWFKEYKQYFVSKFLIGKPLFDVDFAGLMVLFGRKTIIANDYPLSALHIHHGNSSVTDDCLEKTHNEKTHNENPLFTIANNIMYYNLQYNLCRRKPWGAFINPQKNEKEFQKNFFDSMNIHSNNNIKYIE